MTDKIIILMPYAVDVQKTCRLLRKENLEIPVYEAILDSAKELAARKIAQGTKIILCRGATCRMLRETFEIPIIEIRYDFYDFIESCKRAEKRVSRAALIGFNSNFEIPHLRQFLQFERFEMIALPEHRMIQQAIRKLKEDGIQGVIGGHSICLAAQKEGLESFTMEISDRSILNAINDAMHIYRIEQEKNRQLESISSILDQAHEGIFTIDKRGIILSANQSARRQLGIASRVGQVQISELFPGPQVRSLLSGFPLFNEMLSLEGGATLMSGAPIQVEGQVTGAVITLQAAVEVENMEHELRKKAHTKRRVARCRFDNIIGESEAIRTAKQRALLYAKVDGNTLISGATGTGKELFAQSIHNASDRCRQPFVAINCAALPESVLESELFGYVKGAFTGARNEGKAGIFEQAHTGTIFLDEISEISLNMQAKLLRVIQEREVVRLGDDKIIPIDVRIIASTNRNLSEEVAAHHFREDLYYRLCVLNLSIPPLCERSEDILLLAQHFLEQFSMRFNRHFSIAPGALQSLLHYVWPGNVRQLQNAMECVATLCTENVVDIHLVNIALEATGALALGAAPTAVPGISATSKPEPAPVGRRHPNSREILRALEDCAGNKAAAAKQLGIGYTTLWRKLKKMGPM